ncbi:MAG: P-loop NTPase family protein [Pirellulaceae bacterium]
MSHSAPISTSHTRTMSPLFRPPATDAPPPARSAGTTYEMCLALEHDEPRLARQFRRLRESIVSELPKDRGGTILFVGTGSRSHVADVAGQMAKQMTIECHSKVILVDADAGQKVLSQRFAAVTEKGLVDAVQDGTAAGRFTKLTAIPHLSFLAFGESLVWRRIVAHEAVHGLVTEWRQSFRYAVISAGGDLNPLTSLLARCCDATYLVVQLGQAEKDQMLAVARELTAAGARLLGSVATGVRG